MQCERAGTTGSQLGGGAIALAVGVSVALAGCDTASLPPLFGRPIGSLAGVREDDVAAEPNDDFDQARPVLFAPSGSASVAGVIAPTDDLDLFDLGTITPGDRIIIDVIAQQGGLDAVIALFDDAARLVAENDDRDFSAGALDPFLDVVARHGGVPYFLGIAAATHSSGPYTIVIRIVPGDDVPPPRPQTVLLDFDGGTIQLPGRTVQVVGPFDAADVDPGFAGKTERMKDIIIVVVNENFAPFDVTVLNTDDDTPPPEGTFSRVLFGGFSPDSFGASFSVDAFNIDPADEAIIYTEIFTPHVFVGPINADDAAVAMGNVASHEFGHLLGLNHVADPRFLMDTVGRPDTLLLDQDFGVAPLDVSIFPIGDQDGGLLLSEIVGPAP